MIWISISLYYIYICIYCVRPNSYWKGGGRHIYCPGIDSSPDILFNNVSGIMLIFRNMIEHKHPKQIVTNRCTLHSSNPSHTPALSTHRPHTARPNQRPHLVQNFFPPATLTPFSLFHPTTFRTWTRILSISYQVMPKSKGVSEQNVAWNHCITI